MIEECLPLGFQEYVYVVYGKAENDYGIDRSIKNGSQHKARHAFAQRAEEKDIYPKVLQKFYRHESILTTMVYQSNFSFKKADAAVDTVLNF